MDLYNVKLTGSGSYLPGEPVPFSEINNYLGDLPDAPGKIQRWLDKNHKVMTELLGIDFCHYAFDAETREWREDCIDMAVKASLTAIERAGLKPEDIDFIAFGGNYSHQIPPMSTIIQERLGIEFCSEIHVHSNCTSIYKALTVAHDFLKLGRYRNALVVSSNISSSFLRREYYNQAKIQKKDIFLRWYLSDGAGAVVLQRTDKKEKGFFLEDTYLESPGGKKLSVMGFSYPGYYENPLKIYEDCAHHGVQLFQKQLTENFADENGYTIFFNGLKRMVESMKIDLSKLKYFLINMPTKHVVEYILKECTELGIDAKTLYTSIQNIGYSGPPAAIITLDKVIRDETFNHDDLLLSFVTEVSKFIQAGFTLRYVE